MGERHESFKFEKAVSINSDAMKSLNDLFCSYFEDIKYSVVHEGIHEVIKEDKNLSFEELMNLDVSPGERIERLTINSQEEKLIVQISPIKCAWANFDYTVYARICHESKNEVKKFRESLEKICNEATPYPHFFYTVSPLKLALFTLMIIAIRLVYIMGMNLPLETNDLRFFLVVSIFFGILLFFTMQWERFFPPVVFLWGDEETREKRRSLNRKFIGAILIAIIVEVLLTVGKMVVDFVG